jgi:hypothetical protein
VLVQEVHALFYQVHDAHAAAKMRAEVCTSFLVEAGTERWLQMAMGENGLMGDLKP